MMSEWKFMAQFCHVCEGKVFAMFSCKSAVEERKKMIFLLVATNFPTLLEKTTTDLWNVLFNTRKSWIIAQVSVFFCNESL